LYYIVNQISHIFPELANKSAYSLENKGGSNVSLVNGLFILLPCYIALAWVMRNFIPLKLWTLMLLSEIVLFDYPLLALRLFILLFFSAPMIVLILIKSNKTSLENSNFNKIVSYLMLSYTIVLLAYKIIVNFSISIDVDPFRLFDYYSPAKPIVLRLFGFI
jgi:hypothetical protein